jgi:hypothetical protein
MFNVEFKVSIGFDKDVSLVEEDLIKGIEIDIERGIDKEGWCADVEFLKVREIKGDGKSIRIGNCKVLLDPDMQGETMTKIQRNIKETMDMIKLNLKREGIDYGVVIGELVDQLMVLTNLLVSATNNELTANDLEFIDELK